MARRTDAEVMALLRSDSPLNKARMVFSSASASIEQAGQQRDPLPPVEMRRLEFEAVEKIASMLFPSPQESDHG
jgi:hypothetical protein